MCVKTTSPYVVERGPCADWDLGFEVGPPAGNRQGDRRAGSTVRRGQQGHEMGVRTLSDP